MNEQQFIELLNATHQFPCAYTLKVIGEQHEAFVQQVVAAVREVLSADQPLPYSTRATPAGRHVAVTLEPHVESAEQVLAIHRSVRQVSGIVLTM